MNYKKLQKKKTVKSPLFDKAYKKLRISFGIYIAILPKSRKQNVLDQKKYLDREKKLKEFYRVWLIPKPREIVILD